MTDTDADARLLQAMTDAVRATGALLLSLDCPPRPAADRAEVERRFAAVDRPALDLLHECLDGISPGAVWPEETDTETPDRGDAWAADAMDGAVQYLQGQTVEGRLRTEVVVDSRRLGLRVDANVFLQLSPDRLDAAGRVLAAHPAVHGVMATTGRSNLTAALWLPDREALYRFLSRDLAGLGVTAVETFLVGRAVKRPGLAQAAG